MKKILFFVAFALPLSMFAQKTPSAVQTAFKKRFPTVMKMDFDKEKSGEYEAEFKMNGVKMSANFTAEGIWRETESEIAVTDLPANITKAITKKYPAAKVVGAAKIETSDRGIIYEADLKIGVKKIEVLLKGSCDFIN